MQALILVGLGGALGSIARYLAGALALRRLGPGWPYGTFAVNVLGGLLIGALVGFLAHRGGAGQDRLRLLLQVGVLGGFTTFSSFSLEVSAMIERRAWETALAYAFFSVVVSVAAVFAGLMLARRLFA